MDGLPTEEAHVQRHSPGLRLVTALLPTPQQWSQHETEEHQRPFGSHLWRSPSLALRARCDADRPADNERSKDGGGVESEARKASK